MEKLIDIETLTPEQINYLCSMFVHIASKTINKDFVIEDNNKEIVWNLIKYFTGNKSIYDLKKGIMLCGSIGFGKTTLLKSMRNFINETFHYNKNTFATTTKEQIIKENDIASCLYVDNENENEFGVKIKNPKHVAYNELCADYSKLKNYGSDSNEIEIYFLMKRYDIYQDYRKLTHYTTNHMFNDLKAILPEKQIDRFKETCNIIQVTGNSRRK
jgi:energy-coupling factor transporter ATP-binding protein EcfA2